MFTGIVTHVGEITEIGAGEVRDLVVASTLPLGEIAVGASVMHSGVCLTVVDKGDGWHRVQAAPETLARTTAQAWAKGRRLNLERSLRVGDELGGHLVFGHVDAMGCIRSIEPEAGSFRVTVEMPRGLAPLVAVKGSIAVDGISLTVNGVDEEAFTLGIIPHTWAVTTLAERRAGEYVNLEADMLARYVARRLGFAGDGLAQGA